MPEYDHVWEGEWDDSVLNMRATFRNEVHVVSPILRPDGSHNTYTMPAHAAYVDCFAANRAAMAKMVYEMPVRESRAFGDEIVEPGDCA